MVSTLTPEAKKTIENRMDRVLRRIGLKEWTALWMPDASKEINGQVLSEQKTILIFNEDPAKVQDSFLHEVLEVKLQKYIDDDYVTVNGLIKIIEQLRHRHKERMINDLVPLIRHLFDE
ncbi:hypothetical protein ES703_106057 [subsurface metagenome]